MKSLNNFNFFYYIASWVWVIHIYFIENWIWKCIYIFWIKSNSSFHLHVTRIHMKMIVVVVRMVVRPFDECKLNFQFEIEWMWQRQRQTQALGTGTVEIWLRWFQWRMNRRGWWWFLNLKWERKTHLSRVFHRLACATY